MNKKAESKLSQREGLFRLVADAYDKLGQAVKYDQANPDVLSEEDSKALENVYNEIYTVYEELTHSVNEMDPFSFQEREKKLRERGVVAMSENIIKKLAKIANKLDRKGAKKEADILDGIIQKMADDMATTNPTGGIPPVGMPQPKSPRAHEQIAAVPQIINLQYGFRVKILPGKVVVEKDGRDVAVAHNKQEAWKKLQELGYTERGPGYGAVGTPARQEDVTAQSRGTPDKMLTDALNARLIGKHPFYKFWVLKNKVQGGFQITFMAQEKMGGGALGGEGATWQTEKRVDSRTVTSGAEVKAALTEWAQMANATIQKAMR